jgi:phospholipid/cholesterol/gamma-HCH transport system substrate-binding protein
MAQMKVGVLVTIALVLFAAVILQRSWGIHFFVRSDMAVTYLPDVAGLKPGAPVWLAGIEIGKVKQVTIVPPEIYSGNEPIFRRIAEIRRALESINPTDPNAARIRSDLQDQLRNAKLELHYVEVKMEIQHQYLNRLSRDSEVSIESRGLIGDSFIDISPGALGEPPAKQGDYYLIEGVRTAGFRQIMTGANDVIANFGVLSDQIKDIALKINPDKVGSGLSDTLRKVQDALKEATATFDHATLLMEDLRSGKGTFGKMVSDPAVYDRLASSLEKFNQVADELQSGSGTLGKLIKDPQVYDEAKETLRKANVMMDRIEKGEGTLGKLSKDDRLYENARQAIDKLASFVEQIDSGQGTMGKLLKDPSLYNNLDQSTAEITKLIYDLRQDPKKYLTIRFRLF